MSKEKFEKLLHNLIDTHSFDDFNELIDNLYVQGIINSADIACLNEHVNDLTCLEQIEELLDENSILALQDPEHHKKIELYDFLHNIVFLYWDKFDLLDFFEDYELLEQIEDSYELERYVESKTSEAIDDLNTEHEMEMEELINNITPTKKDILKAFSNYEYTADEIHSMICFLTNSNKYDNGNKIMDKLKDVLKNNNYIKY